MTEKEYPEGITEEDEIVSDEDDTEEIEDEIDGDEEGDDEAEQEDDTDAEETDEDSSDENELISVTYKDAHGKEVEEELSYEEISEYIAFGKSVSKQDIQYAMNAKPIIEKINMSPILQDFLYYKMNTNFTDEQILWGMHKQKFDKTAPEEKKDFKSIEEEIDYKVQQKLNEELKSTKEAMQQLNYERAVEKTMTHNDSVLNAALNANGYKGQLTEKELSEKLVESLWTVVRSHKQGETIDYKTYKLDQSQANAIVRLTMGSIKQPAKTNKTVIAKNIQRQAKAPKIMGNVSAEKQSKVSENIKHTTNSSQRSANFRNLFK